ncbi:MAG: hypothetical protein GC138_09235 [Gammaproteobacteria bacterium]|nr:hypothetical protein [Gammaproteobacteria bacterium]
MFDLFMAPFSQMLEPPRNPGRFRAVQVFYFSIFFACLGVLVWATIGSYLLMRLITGSGGLIDHCYWIGSFLLGLFFWGLGVFLYPA